MLWAAVVLGDVLCFLRVEVAAPLACSGSEGCSSLMSVLGWNAAVQCFLAIFAGAVPYWYFLVDLVCEEKRSEKKKGKNNKKQPKA